MKKLRFYTEAEFLAQLDDGSYLCDVLEDDYCKLLDEGLCVNLDDKDDWLTDQVKVKNPFSQYILTQNLNLFEQVMFKEHFGVKIDILENKR